MFTRRFLLSILTCTLLMLAACSQGGGETPAAETSSNEAAAGSASGSGARSDGVLRIVATTTQAADIAQVMTAGVSDVEITPLMGAGVDPHLYQPTESDIAAMNEADMVVYSGLNLEGQFDAVFDALGQQGVRINSMGAPVKAAGFTIGGFELSDELVDVDDPHFWFDPRNWELTIVDLADTLATIDPDNSETYGANADAYMAQMTTLFEWAESGLNSVDDSQRFIVTSHDAFQYYGQAFGWQMEGIQGLSTEDEAGVGDIQGTVDFIIENNIPVVFVESSIPPDTIEAVIEAVDAAGGEVRIGVRELYSDAMGEPGTFGGTYVGMIAENTFTILQSYQCAGLEVTIPDWPDGLEPIPDDAILNPDC